MCGGIEGPAQLLGQGKGRECMPGLLVTGEGRHMGE